MRWGSGRGFAMAAVAATAAAGAVSVPAAVARSQAGARSAATKYSQRFDGRSHNGSYIATVLIAARPPQKSVFDIYFRQGSCSDGSHYSSEVVPLGRQGFTPSASGRASFSGYYAHAFTFDRRGKKIHGRERFRVTMTFSGTSVSGVVTDTFTGGGLRCHSGQVRFTAWRDGTPQAPFDASWGSTGHYAGKSDYGDTIGMSAFLPLGLVRKLTVTFKSGVFCSAGLQFVRPETIVFHNLLINGTGFYFSGHDTYTRGSYRYVERYTVSANPLRAVKWVYTVRSYQGARLMGTCRTPQYGGGDAFNMTPPPGRTV